MRIKLFEDFTGSKIGRVRLLPKGLYDITDSIQLYEVANSIFAAKIEDIRIRCYLFLRYQEFYEGYSKDIRGSRFTIDDYIKWYMMEYKNKDMFTYSYDWCGFNIPSESISDCMSGIFDINEYDRVMSKIYNSCLMENGNKKFYLLGVDSLDSDLLNHEMSHGMYYTDPEYKEAMDQITESLPMESYASLRKIVQNMGYGDNVINDEIQAYMSTGLSSKMSTIPNLEEFLSTYKETFDHFLKKNKHPKEIQIEFA